VVWIVLALLGADAPPAGWLWRAVTGAAELPLKAPPMQDVLNATLKKKGRAQA
jgi:hypothetical protein